MKLQALIYQLEHYKHAYSLFFLLRGKAYSLDNLLQNNSLFSLSIQNSYHGILLLRCDYIRFGSYTVRLIYPVDFAFKSKDGNKQKGEQRDLTGEDGSLADAGGATEKDARPRLQGSLHGLAPKPCTLTLDQKVSGFDFVAAEWEVRRRDARVTRERRKAD